ncbi:MULTISPECIES: GMP synthase [unclassified Microbacterium]|uniref:glutamine amidotransferase-related protein n=1 Tax=unclassified Microbacterium TaxID=2609290 RepID=UPI00137F7863|nr:GMP synthase [Microbacterium sp. MAH-37]
MVSLLYVCVRPEQGAAAAEHLSFRRGLGVETLDRHDLIGHPLNEIDWREYDGIVVGGSPFNVGDEEKSDEQLRVEADLERIARSAIDGGPAAMFTCYGIGVVTRMLGGTVGTATPEFTRETTIRITAAGADDPVFGPSAPQMDVLTAHKEGSAEPPPGAVLLATNDDCPVQAYRVGDRLYATQFHPEPTPQDFAHRMDFYRSTGYFDPAEFDRVEAEILATSPTGTDLLRRFAELVGR